MHTDFKLKIYLYDFPNLRHLTSRTNSVAFTCGMSLAIGQKGQQNVNEFMAQSKCDYKYNNNNNKCTSDRMESHFFYARLHICPVAMAEKSLVCLMTLKSTIFQLVGFVSHFNSSNLKLLFVLSHLYTFFLI